MIFYGKKFGNCTFLLRYADFISLYTLKPVKKFVHFDRSIDARINMIADGILQFRMKWATG